MKIAVRNPIKRKARYILLFLAFIWLLVPCGIAFGQKSELITTPKTNNGQKWRIGYYEGGPFVNYPETLREIIHGLMKLGWIDVCEIPKSESQNDAHSLWRYLVHHIRSDYVRFVPDAFWSADWDKKKREKIREDAISRLQNKCVDLVLAMGTWAGQDLADNRHAVPTLVISASNPIKSGIIRSAQDSGFDHVHAMFDPDRYVNQIRFFHNLVGFERLGIVYENSVEGRTYAGMEDVKKVARERHFEVVVCEAPASDLTHREAAELVRRCHAELAPKIDAMYITNHIGVTPAYMPQILEPLFNHRIPTFSMRESGEVENGVMLSITEDSFAAVGLFHAKVAATVFNGIKPRDIEQVFQSPLKITVNLKTAELIGFAIPPYFLKVSDEIFTTIGQ